MGITGLTSVKGPEVKGRRGEMEQEEDGVCVCVYVHVRVCVCVCRGGEGVMETKNGRESCSAAGVMNSDTAT